MQDFLNALNWFFLGLVVGYFWHPLWADFEALSAVYHHKFEELFEQFETLVHERKLT